MAGNREGGLKTKQALLKRLGSEEALREHYKEMGRKGGMTETDKPKGFAADPDRASWAGRLGGIKSKRGPAKPVEEL